MLNKRLIEIIRIMTTMIMIMIMMIMMYISVTMFCDSERGMGRSDKGLLVITEKPVWQYARLANHMITMTMMMTRQR